MRESSQTELSLEDVLVHGKDEKFCQIYAKEDAFVLDEYFKEMENIWDTQEETKTKENNYAEKLDHSSFVELEEKIWDSKLEKRDSSPDFNRKYEKLSEMNKKQDLNKNYYMCCENLNETQNVYKNFSPIKSDAYLMLGKTTDLHSIKVNKINF
jgi:hypothetical protein